MRSLRALATATIVRPNDLASGVSPRFGYTAALQRIGGRWTPERMDAWLTNPRRFAPGTSMGYPGLADPLARADLIAYLSAQH